MRSKMVMPAAVGIAVSFGMAACVAPAPFNPGPGCLIQIFTSPNLRGAGIPVVRDTPEFSEAWRDKASSAKVVYVTWRLFSEPDYKGFMGDYKAPADVPELVPAQKLASLKCIAPEPPPPAARY
jgi:hypothetical protein